MSFQESPSLESLKSVQLPDQKQLAQMRARRRLWVMIGVFAVVIIALSIVNLQQSGLLEAMRSKGIVVETVVDEDNVPLRAFVFVLGTSLEAQTDANGRFELRDVPAGHQEIVVGYLGAARAFPLIVQANTVNDVGTIQFVSTRIP